MTAKLSIVIRFSSLGDIVLTSAFVKKLNDRISNEPEHALLYVTLDSWAPFVTEYFPSKKLKCYSFAKPRNLWKWFLEGCRIAKYLNRHDLGVDQQNIYDLHNVGKSKAFLAGLRFRQWQERFFSRSNKSHWSETWDLTRLRKIMQTPKYRLRRFLSLYLKLSDGYLKSWPVFARHQRLLDVNSSQDADVPTLNILSPSPLNSNTFRLTLVVDAQNWKKRWPKNYWIELLSLLSQHSKNSLDIKVVAANARSIEIPDLNWQHHRLTDLQGKTRLEELPLIAEASDLVVCGNSAWLHISESVGTPVLTLSGPIVEEFGFHPWRKDSVTLEQRLWCRPCSLHGKGLCYNFNQLSCMKDFNPSALYSLITQRARMKGFQA